MSYFLQTWFWMLLFFIIGAILAWAVVRSMYRPIDEVQAELAATTRGDVRR